jgi:undecaprenyl-diphosphatase
VGPPDTGLFRAINQWPQSLGPTMRFFSEAINYPSAKVLLGVLLLGLLAANERTRRTAVQALLAFLIANGMTDLFKTFRPEHRPYQELHEHLNLWVGTVPSFGTASAHAANMAAIAFVFVYHLKWWGSPWVAIALIVGISRVFCGAHYPHQVLLGWVCGLIAGFVVTRGWEFFTDGRLKDKEPRSQGTRDSGPEGP